MGLFWGDVVYIHKYIYIFISPFLVHGITEVFPRHRQLFLDYFWFMQHPPPPSYVPNPPSLSSVPL